MRTTMTLSLLVLSVSAGCGGRSALESAQVCGTGSGGMAGAGGSGGSGGVGGFGGTGGSGATGGFGGVGGLGGTGGVGGKGGSGGGPVVAAPGWSWNLSRDMMLGLAAPASNPVGPWTFMETPGSCAEATALPAFGEPGLCWSAPDVMGVSCWYDPAAGPKGSALIGIPTPPLSFPFHHEGVPLIHPGPSTHVLVRWTNPIGQRLQVQVLGRFTHLDPYGGDGVDWSVRDSSCAPLAYGTALSTNMVPPQQTGVFSIAQVVGPGDTIDFLVERKGNYVFDGTELDVLIVGQ